MAFHQLQMQYFQQLTLVTALLINPALSFLEGSVTSRLQVQIPTNLFREDGYKHKEALFGLPPYGGSISQSLYYSESLLCGDDKAILTPEREETDTMPFILMVDRGGCSFVRKVFYSPLSLFLKLLKMKRKNISSAILICFIF